MARQLIFLGPPGAGKGTISHGVTAETGMVQISTGELLRAAIAAQTPLGREAHTYMVAGRLVPDELVTGVLLDRLQEPDCASGFILDGFPRTVAQAQTIEDKGVKIDCVINFVLSDATIIKRLSGRRLDRRTGKTYNVNPGGFPQPPPDVAEGDLMIRDDDRPEAIVKRLDVYRNQTAPLIDFYEARGLLHHVDVDRGVGEIHGEIMAVIAGYA